MILWSMYVIFMAWAVGLHLLNLRTFKVVDTALAVDDFHTFDVANERITARHEKAALCQGAAMFCLLIIIVV